MRVDSPVFISQYISKPPTSQASPQRWLALETLASAHRLYQPHHPAATPEDIAAIALDHADSRIETLLARITLEPSAHCHNHDGETIPRKITDAFHRAIIKRSSLASLTAADPDDLARALRTLVDLPRHWISDTQLLERIPADLIQRLNKSLVFILHPGPTLPTLTHTPCHANLQAIEQALGRTRHYWQDWAQTVRTQTLPPESLPQDFSTETRQLAALLDGLDDPRSNIHPLLAARLDALDLNTEDALRFACTRPPIRERHHAHPAWQALESLLAARNTIESVNLNEATLADTLKHIHPSAESRPFVSLFLSAVTTERLARALASLPAEALDRPAPKNLAERLKHHAPTTCTKVLAELESLPPRLAALSEPDVQVINLLEQFFNQTAAHTPFPPNESGLPAQHTQALITQYAPSTEALSALQEKIDSFRRDSYPLLGGTRAAGHLRALGQVTALAVADLAELKAHLSRLGIDAAPEFARALATGALAPSTERARIARQLFAQFKSLPEGRRQALLKRSALAAAKIPTDIRDVLRDLRASTNPALPALADLYERLASRVRENLAKPVTPTDAEFALLSPTLEHSVIEHPTAAPAKPVQHGPFDDFIAAMPKTRNIAARQDAVRRYLLTIAPEKLAHLLAQASNWCVSEKMHPTPEVPGRGFFIRQIVPRAADLVNTVGFSRSQSALLGLIAGYAEKSGTRALLPDLPVDLIAARFALCTDLFMTWVMAISSEVPTTKRREILSGQHTRATPLSDQDINTQWLTQIENLVRENARKNYLAQLELLMQVPIMGFAIRRIWEHVLDLYAAQGAQSRNASHFIHDEHLIKQIIQPGLTEFGSKHGHTFAVLSLTEEFVQHLRVALNRIEQLATSNGHNNAAAFIAHLILESLLGEALNPQPISTVSSI